MAHARSNGLRRLCANAFIVLAAIAVPASLVGQSEAETPTINAEAEIDAEMVFLAGEEIVASQNTTDDLFAAGSIVEAKGASADHLFLAG